METKMKIEMEMKILCNLDYMPRRGYFRSNYGITKRVRYLGEVR